jgi:predicted nucleic acid-binding protein
MATTKEVFELIEEQKLNGKGVGLVDIYLLAGCLIDGRTKLLTADKRLAKAAEDLGINFSAS